MKNRDSFRHQGLRSRLVEEVRAKGISDQEVLNAIGKVPRHLFMDTAFVKFAYRDNGLDPTSFDKSGQFLLLCSISSPKAR